MELVKKDGAFILRRLLACLFLISVCSGCMDRIDDVQEADGRRPLVISGSIEQECTTRADDGGFADGDCMGVFVVDYEDGQPGMLQGTGNRANNLAFTYYEEKNSWISPYDIYWKDSQTPVDVYGYYPYNSGLSDVNAYRFEVSADQSQPGSDGEMGNYEASDFLWAKATKALPEVPVIRLAYQHLMAGISVSLEEGSGFADNEWEKLEKQVLVCNLCRLASIHLATGQVTVNGEPDKHIIMASSGEGYRAVVVPQTVSATRPLLCIRIGEIDYFFQKESSLTLVSDKLHKFTIQVDKRAETGDCVLTLKDEAVTAWENDEVSHNFEANAYVVVNCPQAGTLKACIEAAGQDCITLKNLKVTGELTTEDFYFMRDEMLALEALNLKEVRLKQCKIMDEQVGDESYLKETVMDDVIPNDALKGKSSLSHFIFPEQLKRIGMSAFSEMTLVGNIEIPEGVTHIGTYAFRLNYATGELNLPNSLEYIGSGAFDDNRLTGELQLPAKLAHIGGDAFISYSSNLCGAFQFPENLVYLGRNAFWGQSGSFDCEELVIPEGIKIVPEGAMRYNIRAKRLVLHDGITEIARYAFNNANISGELYLPSSIRIIEESAFSDGQYSGTLKLPEKLLYLGPNAFSGCRRLTGELRIPSSLEFIEESAFAYCSLLESLYIPEYVTYIGNNAFNGCTGVNYITCMAKEPPVLGTDVFAGLNMGLVQVYVPEESVEAYRHADGWKDFISLNARYELESDLTTIKTLNKGTERSFILLAGGAWSVESLPEWCTLSAMNGSNKKTELTLTVQPLTQGTGNREGEIIFKLDEKDYRFSCKVTQYDTYAEGTEIRLQSATKGKGVQLFLLGDGFDAQDIAEGRYLDAMKQQMENFFDVEPFRSYRDYFTVNTTIVESPEQGIGSMVTARETRFNTSYDNSSTLLTDYEEVRQFVVEAGSEITDANLADVQIVLVTNSNDFGGKTEIWADGGALSICPLSTEESPYDARGIIQHEAGGHGFGKLGDEGISHYDFITTCCCPMCQAYNQFLDAKSHGWYQNLSLSGKMSDVPWKHLIFDSRYSEVVDIYEGGYNHARAVYRSEASSIMSNYRSYFNTISRETIVRRIMELAGETFDFEKFVAADLQSMGQSKQTRMQVAGELGNYGNRHRVPRFHSIY